MFLPAAKPIGPGLYAYISDNDSKASPNSNGSRRKGSNSRLVIAGVDAKEGGKPPAAIRSVSNLPVKYIVNTHYHPDHQGGNSVVGAGCSCNQHRLDASSHHFDESEPACGAKKKKKKPDVHGSTHTPH